MITKNEKFIESEEQLLELVLRRCEQLSIKPLAILLHGSRTSGNGYPESDWDVMVLVNSAEVPKRIDFMMGGSFVDLLAYKYNKSMSIDDFIISSKLMPAQKFKLIWFKDKKIAKFTEEVISELGSKYIEPRATWDSHKRYMLQNYFYRNIFRISGCTNPLRRQDYIALFIDKICRNQYFHFTNQHNHSISESYKIIKNADPRLYKLLIKLPRLRSRRAIKNNLTAIYEYFKLLANKYPGIKGKDDGSINLTLEDVKKNSE